MPRTGNNEQQMWSLNYLSQDGDVAFTISGYENFVYRYLNYVYGGYFVCAGCGKIFKQNKNCTRAYCKECATYHPIEAKTVICIDCGNEFKVNSKANNQKRCPECYKMERKRINRQNYLKNSDQSI